MNMKTATTYARNGPYYLCSFDPLMAPILATWVKDAKELFWLAPSTSPPLTAAKVLNWQNTDVSAMVLRRDQTTEVIGYLELNLMPSQTRHLWMGHCIIRPERRGCGLGRLMVGLAIEDAFVRRQAESVSLVVFPDNLAAVECYRSVGFVTVGEQFKEFQGTSQTHRMLRMSIARQQSQKRS